MNNVVFSFNKPSPDGTLANTRTATFVSEELGLPLICDGTIANDEYDILFLVAGVFLYCKCLPEVGAAVRKAKRVVWIQNDYTIAPPLDEGIAESPFRYAFRWRKMEHLPPTDFWTTCERNIHRTDGSAYLNWNSMAYQHMSDERFQETWDKKEKAVFYFGADRVHRAAYFDRYFKSPTVPMAISSFSKSMARYHDPEHGIACMQMFPRSQFYSLMEFYQMGLYLEDTISHREFTSPATRFYEMLSAGMAIIFQPEAAHQMKLAGYNVVPYTCHRDTMPELLERARDIASEQRATWASPSINDTLKQALHTEYERMKGLL
jgi:hypothetical protein